MPEKNLTGQGENSEEPNVDRRTMLKGLGTTAVAGAGVVGMSGSAAATFGADIEIIDFDETEDEGSFEADEPLPVVDDLLIFVHGWLGNTGGVPTVYTQTKLVLDSVQDAGYSPDQTVGIKWPAFNPFYFGAESETEGVGAEVARLIEEFQNNGGGNVHLTGHSLGGRIVYWTINKIGSGYELDTVGAMGTAAYSKTVCPGNLWYEGIVNNADTVRNYYSRDDGVVGTAYDVFGEPLGAEGAACDGTPGYTDVDVTETVATHLGYLGDDQVGRDLATVIQND